MAAINRDEVVVAMRVVAAVYETIQECGEQGAPTGVMYAALCHVLTLEQFQQTLRLLQDAGVIEVHGFVAYAKVKP